MDYMRCRYETLTALDSHGGKFNEQLYKRGFTLMGMYDHENEMEALVKEWNISSESKSLLQ